MVAPLAINAEADSKSQKPKAKSQKPKAKVLLAARS
jgi:hypothetical protein